MGSIVKKWTKKKKRGEGGNKTEPGVRVEGTSRGTTFLFRAVHKAAREPIFLSARRLGEDWSIACPQGSEYGKSGGEANLPSNPPGSQTPWFVPGQIAESLGVWVPPLAHHFTFLVHGPFVNGQNNSTSLIGLWWELNEIIIAKAFSKVLVSIYHSMTVLLPLLLMLTLWVIQRWHSLIQRDTQNTWEVGGLHIPKSLPNTLLSTALLYFR